MRTDLDILEPIAQKCVDNFIEGKKHHSETNEDFLKRVILTTLRIKLKGIENIDRMKIYLTNMPWLEDMKWFKDE